MVNTIRRGATRHNSASPAVQSSQWCIVRMAIATSAEPDRRGSAEPLARTAGAAPARRCDTMTLDGSTATTIRSRGS